MRMCDPVRAATRIGKSTLTPYFHNYKPLHYSS